MGVGCRARGRVLRASISPDNEPSLALIRKAGFVEVGSQIDEIDGLELIFEKPAATWALRLKGMVGAGVHGREKRPAATVR